MSDPVYSYPYTTYSTDSEPAALQGFLNWTDTGDTANGRAVYTDPSEAYVSWYDGAAQVISLDGTEGGTPSDYFIDAGGGYYDGFGTWSGSVNAITSDFTCAWHDAEETAFESLADYIGTTEGIDCFRGFLPVQGDSDEEKLVNVWLMTSGDSGEFEMDRIYGANANWCSLRSDARIESLWQTREQAMKFAGAVISWLKLTTNLSETGNVTWCTLADIPAEPQIYRTDGPNRQRYWRQTIDLELVYRTTGEYE